VCVVMYQLGIYGCMIASTWHMYGCTVVRLYQLGIDMSCVSTCVDECIEISEFDGLGVCEFSV
jgi:hypothetical protein